MKIGNKVFENYTYVMAIINLTPDSFYSGSRVAADSVLFRVEQAIKEGAAIIDLGAQSTRPGSVAISCAEELDRLEKPLLKVLENFDIPVSVDTFYPQCAAAALKAGAHMVNDVSGNACSGIYRAVAENDAALCIMHNEPLRVTEDVINEVITSLKRMTDIAVTAGVQRDKIVIDGGIGFAKSKEQSLKLLEDYHRLGEAGYPLLLGASRKSLFGGRVEDRLLPTLESTRLAAKRGVLFVRVHDVEQNCEVIKREYERNNN